MSLEPVVAVAVGSVGVGEQLEAFSVTSVPDAGTHATPVGAPIWARYDPLTTISSRRGR